MAAHNQITAPVNHVMGKLHLPGFRFGKIFHRPPMHESDHQITVCILTCPNIRLNILTPLPFPNMIVNSIIRYDPDGYSIRHLTDQRRISIGMKDPGCIQRSNRVLLSFRPEIAGMIISQ